jgi:RNA binding exosome subunit
LSSKTPVAYIDVRLSAHATEDQEKVLEAFKSILPDGSEGKIVLEKKRLTGHHGNEITLIETKIQDKHIVQGMFEKLSQGMSILDKESLSKEFSEHLERGNIYLRLDKQAAFLKEIKLGQTDPIHLRIHFKNSDPEEIVAVCRKFGLIP